VHPLYIGCAELGDMPETFAYSVPEEQALATICAFFDGPITFLDLDRGHRGRDLWLRHRLRHDEHGHHHGNQEAVPQ
jgi:hypothetical protein